MAQWLTNPTRNHGVAVQSLALLSGLGIRRCRKLWCRLQTWLGSRVAVALPQTGGYSSDSTPSLGTSICHGCGPIKGKKKKEKTSGQSKEWTLLSDPFNLTFWKSIPANNFSPFPKAKYLYYNIYLLYPYRRSRKTGNNLNVQYGNFQHYNREDYVATWNVLHQVI